MTVNEALAQAVEHHRAGRLQQAEGIYRQILAAVPGHADALHLLGVVAHQVGRNDAAEPLIREAIGKTPGTGAFHNNLGQVLRALGRHEEAVAAYRRAAQLNAQDVDCRANLAIALRELGRVAESVEAAREAVRLDPRRVSSLLQLAMSMMDAGDFAGAVQAAAGSAVVMHQVGIRFMRIGRPGDGVEALRRTVAMDGNFADARVNYGQALLEGGDLDGSLREFQAALALRPGWSDALMGMSRLYLRAGRAAEAVGYAEQAQKAGPESAGILLGLGAAYSGALRHEEAVAAWRRVVEIEPGNATAHNNIAATLTTMGASEEALPHYRKALEIDPGMHVVRSNMLLDMHYSGAVSAEELFAEHVEYGRRLGGEEGRAKTSLAPTEKKRLRVGYFSPDFRAHSVADFIAPLLAGHDRSRFEVVCYANVHVPDVFTTRLKGHADVWRDVVRLSDEEAAALIRGDGVDILVDLAGHTAHGRLGIFARRAAPVQVTYLGYPDTTGLAAMDYRLTDVHADPVGMTEAFHTERLLRLPRTAWCYHAYPGSPAVGPGPVEECDVVTFGSFNNLAKVSARTVELWASVLRAVPGSRMVVKAAGLSSESARARLLARFAAHGVEAERIEMIGRIEDFVGHLGAYGRVDIGLDTYPYHGTTTTCEALYMGVPVVTLAGRTHVSRVGVSLLNSVGLEALVAADAEAFVRIAAGLAGDRERLAELRATLRGTMERLALMDAAAFVRDVERAYEEAWAAGGVSA